MDGDSYNRMPLYVLCFADTLQLPWVQRMLKELYTDTLRLWREGAGPCRSESASSQGGADEEEGTPLAESFMSVPLSAVLSARSLKTMRAPSVGGRLQHKRSSTTESCFQWRELGSRTSEKISTCAKVDCERTALRSAKAAAYDDIYIRSTCDRKIMRMYHRSTDFSTRRKDFSPVCALLTAETPIRAGSEADEDRRFAKVSKPRPTNTHSLQRRWVAPGFP